MFEWAFIFLFLTSIAAFFAINGVTAAIAYAARVIFYILLFLSLLALFSCLFPKRKTNSKRLQIDIK